MLYLQQLEVFNSIIIFPHTAEKENILLNSFSSPFCPYVVLQKVRFDNRNIVTDTLGNKWEMFFCDLNVGKW